MATSLEEYLDGIMSDPVTIKSIVRRTLLAERKMREDLVVVGPALAKANKNLASAKAELEQTRSQLAKAIEAAELFQAERDNAQKVAEAAVLALEQYGAQPLQIRR